MSELHDRKPCPECGRSGRMVEGQTVKALLAVSLRQLRNAQYWFCGTPTCPVVYFSADGLQTFTVNEVRERVFQKESNADDVLVCYCFFHRVGAVRLAIYEERAAIIGDINLGIQLGQCACDLRNPQGACCLGNVRWLVKRFTLETATAIPGSGRDEP